MCKFCILQYTRQHYNRGITIIFCFQTRPGINRPAITKIKFESQNINVHIYIIISSYVQWVWISKVSACQCSVAWFLGFFIFDTSIHFGPCTKCPLMTVQDFFYGQWWEKQRSRTESLWYSRHRKRYGILCTCHINKALRSWPGKTWARFPYNRIQHLTS